MAKQSKKCRTDAADNNRPGTLSFNVGGTSYQVSRSLLDRHPDTMLTRMASDAWHSDPEEPLFVERDGGRFRYVLDYMRDGRVSLPGGQGGVTKTSLLDELTYYGFTGVKPDAISAEFQPLEAPKYIARLTKEHKEELEHLIRQRDQKNREITASIVAHACCVRYMTTGSHRLNFVTAPRDSGGSDYYSSRTRRLLPRNHKNESDFAVVEAVKKVKLLDAKKELNESLSKYGLSASTFDQSRCLYIADGKEVTDVCEVTVTISLQET